MKNLLLIILALTGFTLSGSAQDKSRTERRADKYYFVYSFEKAIDLYNRARHLSTEGQRHLAISYQNTGQNIKAESAYSKLVNTAGGNLSEDYYSYAMVLKSNGKYEESNTWMNKFSQQSPNDLRAKDYLANRSSFVEWARDKGQYTIVHQDVNTDAADFGASYFKNQVVFISSRGNSRMYERKYNWDGQPFLDMFVSDVDQSQLKGPKGFDKKLNRKMHDGPASFSNNGTFMAYTRNDYDAVRKDRIIGLQIFFSKYENGEWTKSESFELNNPDYSVGHPSLTADGKTMYFISDMPGGFGGADIYRVVKDDKGEWGKAENMGNKINTEGDELFPFYQESNDILLFSSNGRYGLGGQDIFICTLNGTETGRVYNAGYPLNTQYDDFSAVMDADMHKGYFSSNRTGGTGGDDIYSFDLLKPFDIGKKIEGIAKDKEGNAVPQTFVTLLDEYGNWIDTVTTDDKGRFRFFALTDKNYKLKGQKNKYIDGTNSVSTFGNDYIVKADITLLKRDEFIAQEIKVGADLGVKIPDFKMIYFDLDKSNIRPDAEPSLNEIVRIMNLYPDMVVQISAYTDCREDQAYNQILSDKRAKSTVDYIRKRITKPERISGKGYGKVNLVNGCSCEGDVISDCSEAEHQKNRRTEFIIKK